MDYDFSVREIYIQANYTYAENYKFV